MESAHRYFRIGAPLILEWTHQSTGICTFQRIQDCICGNLIFLDEKEINNYLKQVTQIADIIGKAFEEKYSMLKYGLIANYYFNNI